MHRTSVFDQDTWLTNIHVIKRYPTGYITDPGKA